MNRELYIGLISGTSMDAVDCALVEIIAGKPLLQAHSCIPMPPTLQARLLELSHNRHVDLPQLGACDQTLGHLFADAVQELLAANALAPDDIRAIGSHGQTIWHQPPGAGSTQGFTIQIGDPNTIAERTGITTVADFRRRDMAAGGQGAPIVPALHKALFHKPGSDRIVLNLGGIANITLLPASGEGLLGMDTGPASVLMDAWIHRHQQLAFDADGKWAASADADPALLELLLDEPFFRLPPPKSTGRELFNLAWLDQKLALLARTPEPACVQATLLALTVESIARASEGLLAQGEMIICGGGAHNGRLMQGLQERLKSFKVGSSAEHGLAVDYVEAVAFAWFASLSLRREACDFKAFTGASHNVIAGGIYYSGAKLPASDGE